MSLISRYFITHQKHTHSRGFPKSDNCVEKILSEIAILSSIEFTVTYVQLKTIDIKRKQKAKQCFELDNLFLKNKYTINYIF